MYHYFVILLNEYYIALTDLSMIIDYIKEQVFEVMSELWCLTYVRFQACHVFYNFSSLFRNTNRTQ